jgi:hypothetical protein
MSITEIHNGVSYSPPSSQRGYQPPTPTPEWRAPDVAAPAVNAEGSIVQQAHKKMVHANNEFRSHLDATEAIRANFSPEGYQAQIDAFQNTSAAKDVDRALESVTARRDAAAANVDKVRKSLSPNGDTASELRATRVSARMVRQLDAKQPGELFNEVNDMLASANREELGVLLVELPAYLQSRGSTSDWIEAAVANIVPELAAARAEHKRAEQAFQIMRTNAQHVRQGFTNGRPAAVIIDPSKYDPDA